MARTHETVSLLIQKFAALTLLASAVQIQAQQTLLSRLKMEPGLYVWDGLSGGPNSGDRLAKDISALERQDIHAIRLLLSPASLRAYSMPPLRCTERRPSLKCLFESESYSEALSSKSLKAVMLTTYDFASFGRERFMDPQFLKANRQRVFDEYRDLAESIMHSYSGSGRVFIIGHWEGDNQIYCGSSYNFQTVDDKRYACMYQSPADRLVGLTEWLSIRQEAIAEGRKLAIAGGAMDVEIYHAVEFNTIFSMRKVSGASIRSKEYKGVLDTVVPAVHPDICSYSAWESFNRNRLTKDLQDIMKACAPAHVVVGELGIKDNPDKRYARMVSALEPLKASVPLVFFWQAFEPAMTREPGFGLFDENGKPLHTRAVDAIRRLRSE